MTNQSLAILAIFTVTILSCDFQTEDTSGSIQDTSSTSEKSRGNDLSSSPNLIWESDYVKIYGDSTIDESKISYTERKFEPYVTFSHFPASSTFSGQAAPLDYESNRRAKRFETVITSAYEDHEIDFGGYYVFTRWGCGSSCQQSVLVDLRDGHVYDGPPASLGYEYQFDSRLLIVNPPDSTGFIADCPYCLPKLWIWNEEIKKFEKIRSVR